MLSLSSQSRIFIHALPTDMRMSFDGLCGIVKGDFEKDILEGDYFVFFNRLRDRCKILLWDRVALILIYKRLQQGCFHRVRHLAEMRPANWHQAQARPLPSRTPPSRTEFDRNRQICPHA
jgi:transposase